MHEIGYVEKGRPESVLMVNGKERDFTPTIPGIGLYAGEKGC